MATRTYTTSITVPAGTPSSAPISQPWVTEDKIIDSIYLLIPPGNNGLAGVRVMKGDTQLIPWGMQNWIVGNDSERTWPIGQYTPTGDVSIQAYNTGSYAHTFYLSMQISDPAQTSPASNVTESDAIGVSLGQPSTDPLSPDAILGAGTASALADGTITADEIMPVSTTDLGAPAPPQPAV